MGKLDEDDKTKRQRTYQSMGEVLCGTLSLLDGDGGSACGQLSCVPR